MQRIVLALTVAVIGVIGWTQLSLVVSGCDAAPPEGSEGEGEGEEGEGEGEGEDTSLTVGDITFSATSFEGDHVVGTTDCPQILGQLTMTNDGSADISVSFNVGDHVILHNAAGTQIGFINVPAGQSVTIDVLFDCSITTTFTSSFEAIVSEGNATIDVTVNLTD